MAQTVTVTTDAELSADQIADLFELEFDGWCPACKNVMINEGEVLCCACFQEALTFHINTCGCYP